jgi:hypothetical protein
MIPNGPQLPIVGEQAVNGEAWSQVEIPGGGVAWIRSDLLFFAD